MVLKNGRRVRVALDFDGTLAHDDGTGNFGAPIDGALDFVNWLLMHGYDVTIMSSRAQRFADGMNGIVEWLKLHGFPHLPVTGEKIPYDLLIDDRCLRFDGDFGKARAFLTNQPSPGRWEKP